jgi:hypothetical protein
MTTTHLLGDGTVTKGCASVPAHVTEKLKSIDNVESSRVRTFETFIQTYFAERQIVSRKSDKKLVYGPAQEAAAKYSPGNLGKKKRGASDKQSESQSPSKRLKDVEVFPESLKVKIGDMVRFTVVPPIYYFLDCVHVCLNSIHFAPHLNNHREPVFT